MGEQLCPWCSRPLIRNDNAYKQHTKLAIFHCPKCVEEVHLLGDVIVTPKEWLLTWSGELRDLPGGVPRDDG